MLQIKIDESTGGARVDIVRVLDGVSPCMVTCFRGFADQRERCRAMLLEKRFRQGCILEFLDYKLINFDWFSLFDVKNNKNT